MLFRPWHIWRSLWLRCAHSLIKEAWVGQWFSDARNAWLKLTFRIQQLVNHRIAHDGLHIFSCLSKRNRLHKLFYVSKVSVLAPVIHTIHAGVVGSQGIFHLAIVMVHNYDGQVEYALAAYNAGVDRVNDWRKNGNFADVEEFVESIPFTETREYVQAIMRNAVIYKLLYSKG